MSNKFNKVHVKSWTIVFEDLDKYQDYFDNQYKKLSSVLHEPHSEPSFKYDKDGNLLLSLNFNKPMYGTEIEYNCKNHAYS